MTLNDLSEKSGISRATLSRIEKAEASPTAETLGALSRAYHLPISTLLSPLDNTFNNVIRFDEQTIWEGNNSGYQRRSISPPSTILNIELIEGILQPNQLITYEQPSLHGQEHHIVILKGDLYLTIENTNYQLSEGDCIRYKLFGSSRFQTKHKFAKYLIALSKGA
jgi:transcriptional regulator with XRE-family HTH domain